MLLRDLVLLWWNKTHFILPITLGHSLHIVSIIQTMWRDSKAGMWACQRKMRNFFPPLVPAASCPVPFPIQAWFTVCAEIIQKKTQSSKISKQLHPVFRLYFCSLQIHICIKTDKMNIHFPKVCVCVCMCEQRTSVRSLTYLWHTVIRQSRISSGMTGCSSSQNTFYTVSYARYTFYDFGLSQM